MNITCHCVSASSVPRRVLTSLCRTQFPSMAYRVVEGSLILYHTQWVGKPATVIGIAKVFLINEEYAIIMLSDLERVSSFPNYTELMTHTGVRYEVVGTNYERYGMYEPLIEVALVSMDYGTK